MTDEMTIEEKSYISSKRAAQVSSYTQDYIDQLARKGLIDARRVGGLWYISMESLEGYKKKADDYKPEPPAPRIQPAEINSAIVFDGKEYLSAAKAADLTGYTQDYVGQLARAASILSRQVGNRWYVEKESIQAHKAEKDSLLAAVQTQAVGLTKQDTTQPTRPEYLPNARYSGSEPFYTYRTEESDLMPITGKQHAEAKGLTDNSTPLAAASSLPIKRVHDVQHHSIGGIRPRSAISKVEGTQKAVMPLLLASVATIVIVLSVGYASVLRQNSVYATNVTKQIPGANALLGNAVETFTWIGDQLEPVLTRELNYQRSDDN